MTRRPPKFAARGAGGSWSRNTRGHAPAEPAEAEPPSDTGDFAEIARRHEGYLRRVALRMTGRADVADDLVQETLLRGMRSFAQFRQGSNARTWLVTILTNLFRDHCKHVKVVTKAEPEIVLLHETEELLVSRVSDEELQAAIRALEPELREVVELCYLRQMKYREVAERLKLPVGTIGTRLLRARELLRRSLIAKPPEGGKP